mgnify:CR=1 FL=1
MLRTCLVNYHLGNLPRFFPLFRDSAAQNANVDFLVFTDGTIPETLPPNVHMHKLNVDEFNQRVSCKLNMDFSLTSPYKLCDLKPAYGVLFEEYLENYDFWGMCDLDVIWGRIDHFLSQECLKRYDVITAKETHTTGYFCVFRNKGISRDLFRYTDDYRTVFCDTSCPYCGFDETCHRWSQPPVALSELNKTGQACSIYDIVMSLASKGFLQVHFPNWVREFPHSFNIDCLDGMLTDRSKGEEFMCLHLVHKKTDPNFYIPQLSKLPKSFHVSDRGLRPDGVSRIAWEAARLRQVYKYKKRHFIRKLRGC